MSFTVPIHQVPFGDTFQGPIEPNDITDNGPQSLYVLCCKYIVQNISKITINRRSKIPSDVCDNLIELYRIYGSKKASNTFLAALSCKQCSVVSANLSNLDISDEELTDFLDSQSRTLKSLNISNCNRLSANVLLQANRTLLKVQDVDKIKCLVTIYEVPKDHPFPEPRILAQKKCPFVVRKFYENGKIRTEINRDYRTAHAESYLQNSIFLRNECPEYTRLTLQSNPFMHMTNPKAVFEQTLSKSPKTAYELSREMGLFCHPSFTKQYFSPKKAHSFACYDRTLADHKFFNKGHIHCPFIRGNQIIPSKQNSLFPEEKLDKDQCAFCHGSGMDRQSVLIMPKAIFQTLHFFRKIHYNRKACEKKFAEQSTKSNLNQLDSANGGTPAKPNNIHDDSIKTDNVGDSKSLKTIDIDVPEDDDYSYFDDDLSCSFNNPIVKRPVLLPMREFGYSFNNLHLKNLLSSCDRLLLLRRALHGPHKPDDPMVWENPRDFLARINALESTQSPDFFTMSSASSPTIDGVAVSTAAAPAATSSSCPVLSSCAEAAYFNFETDRLPEESSSFTISIDKFTHHNNNHNFPQFLKKFRPHSHNDLDNRHHHAKAICSRSSDVGDQIDANVMNPSSQSDDKNQSSPASLSSNASNAPLFGQSSKLVQQQNEWINENHKVTCPLHPLNVPSEFDYDFFQTLFNECDSDVTEDLFVAEDQMRFDLFPYKVYRVEQPDYPFLRLVEVVTWSTSALESLSVTRSVPPHLEEMEPQLRQSIVLNRDLEKLRRLTLNDWPVNMQEMFFNGCKYLDRITYLDLSHCKSVGDGRSLIQMTNLETLILYNVKETYRAIDSLTKLKSLKVLDISTSGDQSTTNVYDPISKLRRLVESLPKLTSLDLSGTIMAVGIISALEHRVKNPLDFLGIFHTNVEPSSRNHIPALKVAGDTFEDLILNSCEAYMNRAEMLKKCLNELFQIFRYENGQHDLDRAVKILVCALGRHPSDKMIQVAASATLFYIIKSEEAKPLLGRKIKELIVTRLLDAMQAFRLDPVMLRNGCLNLIHFRIPADVISEYTRLADVLLHIVTVEDDDFLQRLGIYLLNSLACQVDGEQKTIVGNLGAIEKMLYLIESRFNRNICDEVMETAWSTMWNVTDETPINCERFLNNDGMEFFVNCMEKFPQHPELLRNMMGLLGNVSECAHLRYRLMKDDYIKRFVQLLDSQSDGIEVSYNSAGILAHIASDGADIWHRHLPTCNRDEMLARMERAISRWEINSKRNINYRSFEPILRLLRVLSISWQAQYWAVWALANLTRVHSTKYCNLLEKDGGVEVLKSFITSIRPDKFSLPVSVQCLAVITLFQYYLHKRFGNLKGLEHSKKIVCFDLIQTKSIVINFLKKYKIKYLAREIGIDYTQYESDDQENYDFDEDESDDDIVMIEDLIAHYYFNNPNNGRNNGNDEEMFF